MTMSREVRGSDVPGMPPLPPVYEAKMHEMQGRLRAGEFTLEQMPGYIKGEPPSVDTWHNLDFLDVYPKVWGRECGKNGIGRLREVMLTEITEHEKFAYYDLDPGYFPQMGSAYSTLDIGRMKEQSLQYEQALEANGVIVHRIEFPDPPVSAFGPAKSMWGAAELFVLRGGTVLPKRGVQPMGYGRGEYMALWAWTQLGVPVLGAITGKGIFEAGPCFFLAEDVFVSGLGTAHNEEGLNQIKGMVARSAGLDESDMTFLTIEFPGNRYFDPATGVSHHPDLVLSPLDVDKVIAYPPGLDYPTWEWLRKRYTVIEVDTEEHVRFAPANVMLIEPGLVIMHAEARQSIAKVRAAGVEVIEVPYSEFLTEAGGLHCSTGQILRDKGPYSTDR
jgi:N-dimethylarginine dimethylaminohydrolase